MDSLRILKVEYSESSRGSIKEYSRNGEVWVLEGECNMCGVCCERAKMPVKEYQKEDGYCKHLIHETRDGEKIGRCGIFEGRPVWCFLYPRDPYDKLHEECSFKWKRVK